MLKGFLAGFGVSVGAFMGAVLGFLIGLIGAAILEDEYSAARDAKPLIYAICIGAGSIAGGLSGALTFATGAIVGTLSALKPAPREEYADEPARPGDKARRY